jgi:septal ring factor EnvC (AmiA/AmiB activator)
VRSLAGQANTLLELSKQQLADADKNRSHLNDLATSLETQLNELKQKSDVISQHVSDLQQKSDELLKNVNSLDSRAVQTSAAAASGSAAAPSPRVAFKPGASDRSRLFAALGADDKGQKPMNLERINLLRQCFAELGLPRSLLFVDFLNDPKYEQKIGPATDCVTAKLGAGR